MNLIEFICSQIVPVSHKVDFSDNLVTLRVGEYFHSENQFDDNTTFKQNEIDQLLEISRNADEFIFKSPDVPYLKWWYLITNEKYFKSEIVLDKYGRIGEGNLISEFHEILKIPISDVLSLAIQNRLNCRQNEEIQTYFTCDFDFLNIWDVWNLKDFFRESFFGVTKFKPSYLLHLIRSYFLSRYSIKNNGYLNLEMFHFDNKSINVALLLVAPENKKFDENLNYKNKSVQQFISILKEKEVTCGLHANFDTNNTNIKKQQEIFNQIVNLSAKYNRHHYLKFNFPENLAVLEKGTIETDFSLYFPESMLFRCGISSPFFAWNDKENRPFSVKLIPTTLMDGTFSDYMKCDINEAISLSKSKINLCKKYGQSIVLLWHNHCTYKYSHLRTDYHLQLLNEIKKHIN